MRRTIPWLTFESSREREKRQARFYKEMFPFGEEQRELELKLLRGSVDPGSGLQDTDLMYHLLCVKECLAEEDEEDREQELNDWLNMPLTKSLAEHDRQILLALARLEKDCQSLKDFPDIETIRKTAGV